MDKKTVVKNLLNISLYEREGINTLHPNLRDKCKKLIEIQKEKGRPIWIVSTFRSWQEQNDLYAQGREREGSIVTNAEAGQSYHNYGLAFDVAFKEYNWNPPSHSWWEDLGEEGKSLGLRWGGSFDDFGHFEYHPNTDWEELQEFIKNPYENCEELQKTNNQIINWIVNYFKKSN